MAKQTRDVSQALSEADAALTVLEGVISDDTPGRKTIELIAKARAALDRAHIALGEVRQDMQKGLDRL